MKLLPRILLSVCLIFSTFHDAAAERHPTKPIIDGTREPANTYPNVAQLFLGESLCTGTLIAPEFVLTAAHCFFDDSNQQVVGDDGVEVIFPSLSVQSQKVFIHPSYQSRSEACVEGEVDSAIIQLGSPVTEITPAALGRSEPTIGLPLLLVGYGFEGSGPDGQSDDGPPNGIVNSGSTSIESITDTYINWVFDSGEANTAGGDSGGPSFATIGGETQLVGITCGGTGNAEFDTDSFNTRVDRIAGWIDAVAGTSSEPTAPRLLGPTTIQGRSGTALEVELSFTGSAPSSITIDTLPEGLTLSGSIISGTPTGPGVSSSTVTVGNELGTTASTITFNITGFKPQLTVSRATLQFDNVEDEDFLLLRGSMTVARNFRPRGKSVTIQIGRYSSSCRLDIDAGCGSADFFQFTTPLREGGVFGKKRAKFELQGVNLGLFEELSSLGFIPSDSAVPGTRISLPVEITLQKIRYSTTVTVEFRETNLRWMIVRE